MNIMSLNIRGCGNLVENGWCLSSSRNQAEMGDYLGVAGIWGNKDIELTAKWSQGKSGGLLLMWKA